MVADHLYLWFIFSLFNQNVRENYGFQDHAKELHSKFPDMYKDPNHKPELAIALTVFEALGGFRPLAEIQNYLKSEFLLKLLFTALRYSDSVVPSPYFNQYLV